MPEAKTKKSTASVADFLDGLVHEAQREDAKAIDELMREVTGHEPAMWGASIVGYGKRQVTYANGKQQEWMTVGFSPRKAAITLYLGMGDAFERHAALLAKLGKHSTGKGCLYIKKLADVDPAVLKKLVAACIED